MEGTYQTTTPEELKKIAHELVKRGATKTTRLFLFRGPLGAGKTTFIQGMAEALGAREMATSPTFSLVHEHQLPGRNTLYHIDLYRIKNEAELGPLGLHDLMAEKAALVCIEWPDAFMNIFTGSQRIIISITPQNLQRVVTISRRAD